MIRLPSGSHAFTLAEMMIALTGSIIILGALLLSSTQLQRALYASERYAGQQASQRRLIDYLSRDLRRAVGIATTTNVNGLGGVRLAGSSVMIENGLSLAITLPGYYQSESPSDETYDEALPVVVAGNAVDYGTSAGHAPGVLVLFRKQYLDSEGCDCFIRLEGQVQTVVARDATDLHLQVSLDPDGRLCDVTVTYRPNSGSGLTPKVATHDEFLLRNLRTD